METALAAPPTLADLNKDIKHDLTPDPAWEETGEFHRDSAGNRFPVYLEVHPRVKRRQRRSEAGDALWHLRADGTRHRPMMEVTKVGDDVREFVYVPLGNGMCQKNYNFRPAPGEMDKKKREFEEKNALSDLGRALRESGLGIADLAQMLREMVGLNRGVAIPAANVGPTPETQPPAGGAPAAGGEEQPPETYPAPGTTPGTWYLSRDHWSDVKHGVTPIFIGKKREAENEMAKLTAEREA